MECMIVTSWEVMAGMGKAANKAKTKWNALHYQQVKAFVLPEIAISFKAACAASNASMASILSRLMTEYSGSAIQKNSTIQKRTGASPFATRARRRNTVSKLANQLKGAFRGAPVRHIEHGIGSDHRGQRHPREVQPFCNHLRAD